MSNEVSRRPQKGLGKIAMVFAAGTALFSDGYLNGAIGSIGPILRRIYPDEYTTTYSSLVNSMGFAGIVVGMITMGWAVDRIGRKSGMFIAAVIVIVWTIAATGALGVKGNATSLLQALAAYRFLSGIGIGAEYPAGSVAASENTEDPSIKKGTQHMLFILATNCMIDWGFVLAAFVPYILVVIYGENRLEVIWRSVFGFGILPPFLVLLWRTRMHETARFEKESMVRVKTPYWLIFKRYWRSLIGLSAAWFLYNFISYPFGLYSSTILGIVIPNGSLAEVFGWNVVINLFYIPGCMAGAFTVDRVGPKRQFIAMLLLQAVVGFFMSGFYAQLATPSNVAGFAVMYGLFLTFGEAGPGDCLGLLASKSWPTAVRGQMYGVAAAVGKLGAFVGTWLFPVIIKSFPAGPAQSSGPFWIGSGLAIVSAATVFFLVPEVKQNHMIQEDAAFRAYLEESGFDTSLMGTAASDVEKEGLEASSSDGDDKGLAEKASN